MSARSVQSATTSRFANRKYKQKRQRPYGRCRFLITQRPAVMFGAGPLMWNVPSESESFPNQSLPGD